MNVLILGGSGFVGTRLTRHLLNQGQTVTVVASRPDPGRFAHPDFTYVSADTTKEGDWQNQVAKSDRVFNLAGRTIFHLWTESYKTEILDSRIQTTQHLVNAMEKGRPGVLVNASAVGYYGEKGDKELDESQEPGNDFLSLVAAEWESQAKKAEKKGIRTALARFAIVLGPGGGAMAKILPVFKMGMGGILGSGNQWFPWIHLDDLVSALGFIAENPNLSGPFNFCAPHCVRNGEFSETLARVLARPAFFKTPSFLIRTVLGELGQMLLSGQRTIPRALLDAGFEFRHPDLKTALKDICL